MNDQGSLFTGRKMQEFISEMGIKLLTSMPYYAQPNGQVETTNKIVIGLIKKNIGKKPKNWHKTLDQVLWVYRTYPKEKYEERLAMLDVLIIQKEQISKAYNKKVKVKAFSIGELVWKVILLMDRRDKTLGKRSPNWEDPFQIIQAFSNNAYEIEDLTAVKQILKVNINT
ncbi:uncharacterized protein LOC127079274 [Lathyrus oleraceus]|uniref:uncharacterized protein LOC127079274 n=1 Tax=Pisum sativum TaxID=3888 RepID=UPI0021D139E2|nr:uncharacterized protein LOC127079274 [Pisum sativum]